MYGVNTGFADNRDSELLPPSKMSELQENLIRSHASGYGPAISPDVVRGAIVIRAASLAVGNSGVRPALVDKLLDLLNLDLVPAIPCYGSVGASGDLAPLSHLAMALIGEAKEQKESRDGWSRFEPLSYDEGHKLGPKEGLALNNGTAFMASWLALSVHHADNLLELARRSLALSLEATFSLANPFEREVQALRSHPAIAAEAEALLDLLDGSRLINRRGRDRSEASLIARGDDVQDDYSLRCAAVAHGAVRQALDHARSVVEVELRSVTDNPLLFVEGDSTRVMSGAHFHGAILALPADYLRSALTELASISERRVAKLLDRNRNYGLPNYLARAGGIESGLMITQYTAASMINDLKTKCMPHGVDTIPTGNNSEDYVSMGANACRATYEALDTVYGVLAIEFITAARALNLRLQGTKKVPAIAESDISPAGNGLRERLNALLDLDELDRGDVSLAGKIQACVDAMKSGALL